LNLEKSNEPSSDRVNTAIPMITQKDLGKKGSVLLPQLFEDDKGVLGKINYEDDGRF